MIPYSPPKEEEKAYNRLLNELWIVYADLQKTEDTVMVFVVTSGVFLGTLIYSLWKG